MKNQETPKPFIHSNLAWSSEITYQDQDSIVLATNAPKDKLLANITKKIPIGNVTEIRAKVAVYIAKIIAGELSVRFNFFDIKNKLVGQINWFSAKEADTEWKIYETCKSRSEIPENACSYNILVGFRSQKNSQVEGKAYFAELDYSIADINPRQLGKIDAQPKSCPKLILIVGLQKSGTSLMARLLSHTPIVSNPFGIDPSAEGHDFWGNPPMVQNGYPAGAIYERSNGRNGHEIDLADATPEVARVLASRLEQLKYLTPIILNKNPHNVLRIKWLRALFPRAVIVGVVRRSVPCVFSLTKKLLFRASREPNWSADWWGMRVRGWQDLIREDKILQNSLLWRAANQKLLEDQACLDFLVPYHDLCSAPNYWVNSILAKALNNDSLNVEFNFEPLTCLDDEYLQGAELTSNNDQYKSEHDFKIAQTKQIELPALDARQIEMIQSVTKELEVALEIAEQSKV